ncbi:MAG TPA: DUF559 domain-containing protein [Actinomycetota bacterium]|nr:DUF559 domain-containing protein [Actinomycetota bacterium]
MRSGLPRPVRQHRITDNGKLVARVDFAYPDSLVAVEVDGYRWHSGRRAWSRDLTRRDLTRRNRLTSLGWRVLHVTHDDLMERPNEIVEQIDAVLSGGRLSLYPR